MQGKHLVIGNVGDSRAVLGTKNDKGAYVAVQLTVDLKPNLPRKYPSTNFGKDTDDEILTRYSRFVMLITTVDGIYHSPI